MRSNPFKKNSPERQKQRQQQQQQQQEFSIKMHQQHQQRSKLQKWSPHQIRSERVENSLEQQLIISIKDYHSHCRAIPATAQSSINDNNKNALLRKNSTSCTSIPQKPSANTDATALSSFPSAMYSITTVQRQSNKRYPLERSARPHRVSLLRPSAASTLLLICLSALVALASLQQPAGAFFFSDSAASLPLASALLGPSSDNSDSSAVAPVEEKQPETGSGSGDSPILHALQNVVSAAVSSAVNQQQQQQQQPQQSAVSSSSSSPTNGGAQPAPTSGSNSQPQVIPAASGSSASSSVANALVSSISSAVASAAVSAAQNALSGGNARSGASGNGAGHSASGAHPNRAMHLALKIAADAIPEVPYNILHNMKKLDHAAPFYNVGKKSGHLGGSKESTSRLASALSSASHGRFGGAAGQLSTILKSPIWKRIADGYGDFTSEFRSLFRAPANPMKGSTSSSSTKLLRDISVPALLMLIAAAMPSEWRPVRNRRKLLLPSISDIPQIIDPMSTSASEHISSLSAIPFINAAVSSPAFSSLLQANPVSTRYQQIQPRELASALGSNMYTQMSLATGHPESRSGDINLQPESNGFIGQQWNQQANIQQKVRHPVNVGADQLATLAAQSQPQHVSQPSRRVGELALPTSFTMNSIQMGQQKRSMDSNYPKPVNRISDRAPYLSRALSYMPSLLFLSSLTSGKPEINSKLMRRVFGDAVGGNRMANNMNRDVTNVFNEDEPFSKREDQLSDRHRYSMIDTEVDMAGRAVGERNAGTSKPFLLSAMTHALNSALESGLSGLSPNLHLAKSSGDTVEMLPDKSAGAALGARKEQLRRNSQAGLPEQRQLSQLIPQAWKDVIKRTMSTVQQQASTQWRSIEGQFTNWVQDKLKTPSTASSSTSASSSSSTPATSSNAQASAPISNIIASVSSSAMNMFGFGNKSSSSSASPTGTSSTAAPNSDSSVAISNDSSSDGPKNKNDTPAKKQNTAKSAFAGLTNMIASVFTNKQSTTPAAGNNSSKASSTGASTDSASTTSRSSPDTSTTKAAAAGA